MNLADGLGDDFVALAQYALLDPHQRHHTQIVVEPGVDDQGLQGRLAIALRWRNVLDQVLQRILNAQAGLGTDQAGLRGIDTDNFLDLPPDPIRIRLWQVHLVENGQHLQALLNRRVTVGNRLGFHTLPRIHHQQRALTGGQRAGHLVGEIHMAGGINKIELIGLPIRAPCNPG